MIASVRPSQVEEGKRLLAAIDADLDPAIDALAIQASQGSVQERSALDKAYAAQEAASRKLSQLEELMVKDGYKIPIPAEYADLPVLQGRATVEFVLKKDGDEKFNIDGALFDSAVLRLVIDGYNAPLTGGTFVNLVQKGFYNNMKIQRSDGFVVQTGEGDPELKLKTIPLEIRVVGDSTPLWGETTEENGRGYAATVLPFQSFGALGMARTEADANSANSQFFWLLFDSDLTPAGKNLLDGAYTCFGYTVDGADFLKDIKEGDIITKATVISGKENLLLR
jgi:peptidylprolyl isomerase